MSDLLEPRYYGVDELTKDWRVCAAKLKKWLISGKLRCHLWLPVMSVYSHCQLPEGGASGIAQRLEHFEGFVPLTNQHCQRLFRCGELTLRDFYSSCGSSRYQLPDSSEDIRANLDDLLVLDSDRKYFEQAHGLEKQSQKFTTPSKKTDFRSVVIDGQTHYFGQMQADILQCLHQAVINGEPWQNGKRLLQQVGSESFTLSNVFKHKPIWRTLIESDRRGSYRLRTEVLPDHPRN